MQYQWDDLSGRVAAVDVIAWIMPREIQKTEVEVLLMDSALVAATRLGRGVRVWRDAAGFHAHPSRDITPGIVYDTSAIVQLA